MRVLLSLICLLMFWSSTLKAAEEGIPSSSGDGIESIACIIALQVKKVEMKNEARRQSLRLGYEEGFLELEPLDERIEIWAIKVLWKEVPAVRQVLQNFAQKITHNYTRIQGRSFGEDYNYKEELINSILSFMQILSKRIIGEETLRGIMADSLNYGISEDKAVRLTNQIKQLEKLIDRLDIISPIESFIYTNIINRVTGYLNNIKDISEFDLGQYTAKHSKYIFESLNLSRIVDSPEQRSHFLEQYQLLQRDTHQFTGTTQVREQGDEYFIEETDHVSANLRLAQSLHARSVNPIETHIPEFADLMDEHIAYIRKGVSDSQALSDSEKTDRLELLDAMQSKAESYKSSEEVTYLRWVIFNLHLSIIATSNSDLLNDKYKDLYLFILKKYEGNIDFEFIKEWMMNDDGSDIFKIAGLFKLIDHFQMYKPVDYKDNNDVIIINRIAADIGLDLSFDDIRDLDLGLKKNGAFLLEALARRLNLELEPSVYSNFSHCDGSAFKADIKRFYQFNLLGNFIYIFNRFPERMMIPTRHDLNADDFNKTYGTGVHLIGLNNDSMHADDRPMPPFEFFLHDIGHSVTHHNDDFFALSFSRYANYASYTNLDTQLENLPELLRPFMQELYFKFTHEAGDVRELIRRYRQQQRQILFPLLQKLGNLTASEELEFKKAILLFIYFELPKYQERVFLDEDIEFTEESLKDTDVFVKLILKLYMLYEGQSALVSN